MSTALSLFLLFASIVCLFLAMMPDIARRLIRKRVLTEVGAENPPTFLSQLTEVLAPINRRLPTGWYERRFRAKLDSAGVRISTMQFLVMQQLGVAGGLSVYMLVFGAGEFKLVWFVIFLLMGIYVPIFWLGNRTSARRHSLSRDLPEVVDLLTLCVDAGIDFMSALTRVVKEYKRCPTTEELGLVLQEVRVGKRRRDALRAFANRVQTQESSSLSRTLIQADRMGTGLAESMTILSEDMRMARYNWAERFAQQAPLKMLLPLLCSLGAALLIVAGPIMGQFISGGFGDVAAMQAQQ